jgi:hypothetical protein
MAVHRATSACVAIAALIALALVGCTSTPGSTPTRTPQETPMLTPASSRAEISALYTTTQTLIGGKWAVEAQEWQSCTTESGDTRGVSFTFAASPVDQVISDPPGLAKQAQSLWAQHGYQATISEDTTLTPPNYYLSDPPFLSGTGPDGFLIQLTLSTHYADFTAHGRCVAGDVNKLNLSE